MKKAFTLIELLIAATIFIIVMSMVASTMAWISSYTSKLHEMRSVSQANRSAVDMISKDIRLANGGINIKTGPAASAVEIGEIAVANCDTSCTVNLPLMSVAHRINSDESGIKKSYANVPAVSQTVGNMIIIVDRTQRKLIIYRVTEDNHNYNLYRYENTILDSDLTVTLPDLNEGAPSVKWQRWNGPVGSKDISMQAVFSGYTATRSTRTQQPYIEFMIRAESWDYVNQAAQSRSRFDLKTLVESRDYN